MKKQSIQNGYHHLQESRQKLPVYSTSFISQIKNQEALSQLINQIKNIKYPTLAIKPVRIIEDWIQKLNLQQIKDSTKKDLKQKYKLNYVRQIRGDGNCFIRAIIFHYITSLQSYKFQTCFPYFNDIKLDCSQNKYIPKHFLPFYNHQLLSYCLKQNWQIQYKKQIKLNKNNYKLALACVLAQSPYIDFILILYTRCLSILALNKYRSNSQIKYILTGKDQQYLGNYGNQSQGLTHYLLSRYLSINMNIYQLRQKEFFVYEYKIKSKTDIPEVHLLFYNKHYDLLEGEANIQLESNDPILQRKQSYESSNSVLNIVEGRCMSCRRLKFISVINSLCELCEQKQRQKYINIMKKKKEQTKRLETQISRQKESRETNIQSSKRIKTQQSLQKSSKKMPEKQERQIIPKRDKRSKKKKGVFCGCFG